jgi:hypothetical protein
MRSSILSAVLTFLASVAVAAESSLDVHKDGSIIIYLGAYQPSTPTDWGSIPEPARSRIIAHLTNRLGATFFAKLSVVGGQIVDLKALSEKDPESKKYRWEVPAYRLLLRFRLPEVGIEYYDACIDCRSDGSIINEIDLPDIVTHPDRATFISASKAAEIAKKNGYDLAQAEAQIRYRKDLDECVFTFKQGTGRDGPSLFFKCIDIDAHSGKVAQVYESRAIE